MRKSLFLPAALWCVLMAALFSACPEVTSNFVPKLAESVTLSETAISMAIGETRQLSATVAPPDTENKALFWASALPGFATVSGSGLVTAVAEGATVVTATTMDGSNRAAVCTVTVTKTAVKVTSITVSPATTSVPRGSTVQLSTTVSPADATVKTVTWSSSNELVATVDSAGLVTGKMASNTPVTITAAATDGSGVSGTATVTVTLPLSITTPVTSITASPSSGPSPFYPGETFTISTAVSPPNASDPTVNWTSSNPSVASISAASGSSITVTAVAPGTAAITAAAIGGIDKTDTVSVTVNPVLVTSISLSSSGTSSMAVGNTHTISATVEPSNATNPVPNWTSSNPSVASVSGSGSSITVTAVAPGTATITASAVDGSGVSGTYAVTVSDSSSGSITITPDNITGYPGEKFPVNAVISPEGTLTSITWSSGNPAVATVSSSGSYNLNGTITAVSPGTATITAKAYLSGSEISRTCTVTVNPIPVSSISLDKTSWKLSPTGTFQLDATVEPGNATDKTVTWSVSPSGIVNLGASTGSSITVTGAAVGTATITASSGGKTASCNVTVKAGSGLAITFDGFGDQTIDLTPNYVNDLSKRTNDQLTVTVGGGSYSLITWYVDGQSWNSGNSHTIGAYSHSVGVHYLTAVVKTNDSTPKYFSKELSFRVVE